MTQGEIGSTVATPYMGFNLGATKARQDWRGKVRRHVFESALVRLMKDHGDLDAYAHGAEREGSLPAKSVIIYRYDEPADSDLGGEDAPSIEKAASGLGDLILKTRRQVCGDAPEALAAFRVYLAAHSMGGLVCRAFLQNPALGTEEARAPVDKVFTYATPHNGIERAGFNVPSFLMSDGLVRIDNAAVRYKLTERRKETHSAILRPYDQLLKVENVEGLDEPRSPYLFSLFLSSAKITSGRTIVFAAVLAVSSTDYEIDGFLVFDQHIEGEVLFRNLLTVRATKTDDGWNLRYVLSRAGGLTFA